MVEHSPVFQEGWHDEETDGVHPFRWMGRQAVCLFKDVIAPGRKYVHLTAGHSFAEGELARLEVLVNGIKAAERDIGQSFSSYLVPFEAVGDIEVVFRLDRVCRVPGDPRDLGIMFREIEVLSPTDLERPVYGEGWYEWESSEFIPFRWMSGQGRILLPGKNLTRFPFLTLPVFSEYLDMSQVLEIRLGGRLLAEVSLLNRWNFYDISLLPESPYKKSAQRNTQELKSGRTDADGAAGDDPAILTLSLNKPFPPEYHLRDPRTLGVRAGALEFHDDASRQKDFQAFHTNALLNYSEMIEGKTELLSFPTNLGIDIYGKCNIKPPCVYCLWDKMKILEGDYTDMVVDHTTLESYGPFFRSARTLVNCSFGEPLLHPRFEKIMDLVGRTKKILELSTNGQAFTERTIQALVGRPVYLYISLDAATKETYAKIRNDRWDGIVPSLIRLNDLRKRSGGLPKLFLVFMPMRVNRNDLEEYFRLCRTIDADSLVLRPLLYLWNPKIEADRGGYHFDYAQEMLTPEEVAEIFRRCDEYSQKYGVPVANQFNFGIIERPGTERGEKEFL